MASILSYLGTLSGFALLSSSISWYLMAILTLFLDILACFLSGNEGSAIRSSMASFDTRSGNVETYRLQMPAPIEWPSTHTFGRSNSR